ncbi:MAG: HD domain-containing phosphohydrolase [Clostridia bacterium]
MDLQIVFLHLIVNSIPLISIAYIALGIVLFKHREESKVNYFSLVMVAAAIYSFGYFLELNCTSYDTMLLVRNFEFFGATFVPAFGILFVADIVNVKIKLWIKIILFYLSFILWVIFITNPFHHFIYKQIDLLQIYGFGIVTTVKGPSFYSLLLFHAFFVVFSTVMIFRAYQKGKTIRMSNNKRKSLRFMLLSFQIPWLTILIIILGFDKYIDPVPFTIILMSILFLVNETRNNMFEIQIKRWKSTFFEIGEPAFLFDKFGDLISYNKTANALFKMEMDGHSNIARDLKDGEIVSIEIVGNKRWFDVKRSVIDIKNGFVNYLLIDITDKVIANEEIKKSEEKYRLLTENASDVIWILNTVKNKFTYISPSIFYLRGYTSEEAIDERLEDALVPDSLAKINEDLKKYIPAFIENPVSNDFYISEIQQPHKNGDIIWVEVSAKLRLNQEGEIEVVGVSRNIDARKRAEKEIQRLSNNDQLTGVKNRKFYDESLIEFNQEEYLPLSLIMVDVNGLKLTNDAFGHKSGDLLLEMVARVLKKECRPEDVVARIGGDEFIILLPKTTYDYASKIIRRVHEYCAGQKINNIPLSVSIGYAIKELPSDEMKEVFKRAEDEMYRNKLSESTSMRSSIMELILHTLFEKSHREMLHSERVSKICESIATRMGFIQEEINQIRTAGLMHDIGKIGIDEKILNKDGALDAEEWKEIHRHPEIGYRILSSVVEFSRIADDVLSHHEKWNGSGYPRGLQGEEISVQARIIAVADAFDAMTSVRAYSKMINVEEAIEEIKKHAGTQFDPKVVQMLIEVVLEEK